MADWNAGVVGHTSTADINLDEDESENARHGAVMLKIGGNWVVRYEIPDDSNPCKRQDVHVLFVRKTISTGW